MVPATLVLAGAMILSGCTVEVPGIDGAGSGGSGAGTSAAGRADGKLSSNGLVLDTGALGLLEPSALGHWESDTVAVADSGSLDPLASHPQGAHHLEYLALCALADGTELVAGGARYPGLYGLAPAWVEAGCDPSCQRWVSACVLAHANAFGTPVTLSLRGAHEALGWDEEIAAEFTVQEAAFYGNVFEVQAGTVDPAAPLYACTGRALLAWDEDPSHQESDLDYLQERICGTGDCGLHHTGPCVYPPVHSESTCSGDAGWDGFYQDCEGTDYDDPLATPVYPEVITTYLAEGL